MPNPRVLQRLCCLVAVRACGAFECIRRLLTLLLVVIALALPSLGRAAPPVRATGATFTGDPCNFATAFAFGYDEVLACYRSVPFCPDPRNLATCDRDAQVAHLRAAIEAFSDLREIYDPVAHWFSSAYSRSSKNPQNQPLDLLESPHSYSPSC